MTRKDTMLTIDHSHIAPDVLEIANRAAALDPDGQIFPWRDGYPLAGSTVYHRSQLWTVAQNDGDAVLIVGCGHDEEDIVLPRDLRPVSWTQHNELALAQRAETTEIPQAVLDGLLAATEPPIEQLLNERPEILDALVDSPRNEAPAQLFTDPEGL